jgi:hypothetical protein
MGQLPRQRIAAAARRRAARFSDARFMAQFLDGLRPVIQVR